MMATRRASALVTVLALGLLGLTACDEKIPEPTPEPQRPAAPREPEKPEPADLIKEDLTPGTGAEAKEGDKVKVHYTGRLLKTNYVFDSSKDRDPFEFTLGKGEVIKGWDEGVAGMKVGGKRKLTIPSRLGYGDEGSPPKIPGKSTLVFDVELIEIVGDKPADAKAGDAKKGDTKAGDAKKPATDAKKPAATEPKK
ncbi:FKBP-type peptidyl-prolyl cis-trans isomerase [Polyangium aurulentum]|uniref:FKBP-type peptidyl-prolyl cis-trans isomerase n=1 Tax=Polyangium aurulentum TaxID=2567896 RepID=UPI0023DE7A77|nr:FKBP-type peptidyl-prolyl cis-trans isomerase [Polyangium aurulentum]